MIQNLYIKNFKSLKEVDLEMRNLNLLTGLNGSEKFTYPDIVIAQTEL